MNALECQPEVACKRVQEYQIEVAHRRARVASLGLEKQPKSSPTTEDASTATGFDDPLASISQIAAALPLGSNNHVVPGGSVDSASSSKSHASSTHRPMEGAMSTSSIKKSQALAYYTDLGVQGNGKAQSLHDMDLDQLRDLASKEDDVEQRTSAGHVYYFVFLKTGKLEDLDRAIQQAEGQIPVKADNPDYALRLKDLIIMLVKRYEHTSSLEHLQEAIFRAQEMIVTTPPDHPDRPARMSDWIGMMFKKYGRTGSQDELDEAMMAAREAGAMISVINSDRGPTLQIGIPM